MSSPFTGPAPRVGRRLRNIATAAVLGLVASPLTLGLTTAPAHAVGSTGLVITEVYGGGGNSGATYNADFVELFNPTGTDVTLNGLSLQYRSATGSPGGSPLALVGTVPAGASFLVRMGSAGGTGAALTGVDQVATPSFSMAAGAGQILLATDTTAFTGSGDVAGDEALIDAIGYGASTTFEGAAAAGPADNAASLSRSGSTDTDSNTADFTLGVPSPTGSGLDQTGTPFAGSIADIQGDGQVSPIAPRTATTQGLVTAIYPTSGFNGFFLQTGGADTTPDASDGIFVFGPTFDEATLAVGDSVEVTGPASEFQGLTEITATSVTDLAALDPVTPLAAAYPTTAEAREAHEGELLAPTDTFTVTNTFNTNRFAEIGLAAGDTPLLQPSDVAEPGTPESAAVAADNAARGVVLDDGASTDFSPSNDAADTPLPWLSTANPIRVGAQATLHENVILDYRNNAWKFQPTHQVTGEGAATATFENTRTANAAPQAVGGDLKLATFNVLNYFNTTGEAWVAAAAGRACTYFLDRDNNRVGVNTCTLNGNPADGPRGAAQADDLARQQAKTVTAINGLGADIVSLEEIENSVKLGENYRDDAVSTLVAALNAAAGAGTWGFVGSPTEASTAAGISESDVIRTAFIYRKATVVPVGISDILFGTTAFANAREPLAQAFKPKGAPNSSAFAVVVNHFKSKGDSTPPATGDNANNAETGAFNGDRVRQAQALVTFANNFAVARGTDRIFLTGDFNSYTHEDPMQVLYDAGFGVVESDTAGDASYSFGGLSGSLDHVLANTAAEAMVTGADIWEINANESIAFQYSRHNYNVTQFFSAADPFAASDHNPEIVGLDMPEVTQTTKDIQVLATNDFHGRLQNNTSNTEAGAAVLAGAVKSLRQQNPDTVFAAAGDLIGASTFESFIANDKPTIDALNEAGLEVSAVGNHEFDQGYDDLVNRVMAAYDPTTNPEGGAAWQYIGANVRLKATGDPAVPATWIKDFDGVEVGFVGAVTEDLPSLVNPDGISEIEVTDIVASTNAEADALVGAGADLVVLLVHEGAPGTNCDTMDDNPDSAFGRIIHGVNDNVDAIVSGHTHLAYNCSFPVQGWVDDGRAVTTRPVVSAGQYGMALNQLVYSVDPATGEVIAKSQELLDLKSNATTFNYPSDPDTKAIVDAAVAAAVEPGNQVLGKIGGGFSRAKFASGTENRGGESALGNLVAEVQRWATPATVGGAQIAFMNPGGLRADMVGNPGDFPRDLTYRQAANVQPFANTLVNLDLTGAQIRKVLEQQWQRTATGAVPTRAFLKLGASEGFEYTYYQTDDPVNAGAKLGHITGMWLDGEPIDAEATYSVTVNSFLAAGGDNFRELANGAAKQDTGMTDLQAMVEYLAEFGSAEAPLAVEYSQRAVGVTFPADAPASYAWGDDVTFDLSSLSMTDPADVTDAEVTVALGDETLGTFPVTTTRPSSPDGSANSNDDAGTAQVTVTVPSGTPGGTQALTVSGATTGTSVEVPIQVAEPAPSTTTATLSPSTVKVKKGTSTATVAVSADGYVPTGSVEVSIEGSHLRTVELVDGSASLVLGPFPTVGTRTVEFRYLGDGQATPSSDEATLIVVRQKPK